MASAFSRLLAVILGVALTPIQLLLGLLVLLSLGRPVLFRQVRCGRLGEPFVLYKFRTMRDDRDEAGRLLPDEQRVTAVGAFLRRSRLDELPGLLNIARGEMAFVGPRPLLPITIEELGDKGRRRGLVRPGMTGWAQVNGNTLLSLDEKVALDLWYIDHAGLWLDLTILQRTVLVMIGGERRTKVLREEVSR
ncbi:sugar transferase [Altererythrobacter sp. Root672]|uniref:sugar transferase n=1 Tax=Altererythrobacter sp. Root672 TaxID=1736584 RepID=UPI0006F526D4|nr:sugar transferase [Altererythrobacter sp. Root672]KRA83602.1 UDP-galactose phosphate transferase [Altererythrobacter sp. Root672]